MISPKQTYSIPLNKFKSNFSINFLHLLIILLDTIQSVAKKSNILFFILKLKNLNDSIQNQSINIQQILKKNDPLKLRLLKLVTLIMMNIIIMLST